MDLDDEIDHFSIDSNGTFNSSSAAHHLNHQLRVVNEVATAAALQMCSYLQILIFLCHLVPLWTNCNERKRKQQPNVHRDCSSVICYSVYLLLDR